MPEETKEQINLAAKFGAKLRALSDRAKKAEAAAAEATAKLTAVSAELGTVKQTVLTPDAKDKKIAELTGTIRTGKHKARFAELAKAAGASEKSLEALYKLSEHKAETDDPDDDVLGQLVEAVKGQLPEAFGGTPADPANPPPAPAPKTVPGAGRGGPNSGANGTIVTAEMRADPKFMLNPANKDIIAAAAREGRFR